MKMISSCNGTTVRFELEQGERPHHEWSSCEFYGHHFEEGRCVSCGESDGEDIDESQTGSQPGTYFGASGEPLEIS